MSIDVSKESKDFEAWHEQQLRENADYINGSEKHRAWMAWLARATAGVPGTDPSNAVQVDRGALQMALNVLRRAGKNEVADELAAGVPASHGGQG